MITYGYPEIQEAFIGETKNEVIENASGLIDRWPEYAEMENDEIIYMAENEVCEFDLVEIKGEWPGVKTSLPQLKELYHSQYY
jgi:hypothetical protein